MSNEFYKSNNCLVRAYELKKGDRFSVAVSALDLIALTLLFNQEIVATDMKETRIPIRKWFPFIKKKVKYVEFVFFRRSECQKQKLKNVTKKNSTSSKKKLASMTKNLKSILTVIQMGRIAY